MTITFSPTRVKQKMLEGPFYIDGGHNTHYVNFAMELVDEGLLRFETTEIEQYIRFDFFPVTDTLPDNIILGED